MSCSAFVSNLSLGDRIRIGTAHDEYSIWFQASLEQHSITKDWHAHPTFPVEPYNLWNRNRIWSLNDQVRKLTAVAFVLFLFYIAERKLGMNRTW